MRALRRATTLLALWPSPDPSKSLPRPFWCSFALFSLPLAVSPHGLTWPHFHARPCATRCRQQGSIDQDQHGRPRLWEKLEAKHPQQKDSYLCKPCNKAMGNKFSILRHCTMVHKDDPRFAHCWHRCKDNECSCGKLFLEERAIEHHLRQIRFAHRKKKTEGAVTGSGAKPKRARQARRPSPPESAETPGSQDSEPHPPSMTAKGIVGITVGRDESDTAESAD